MRGDDTASKPFGMARRLAAPRGAAWRRAHDMSAMLQRSGSARSTRRHARGGMPPRGVGIAKRHATPPCVLSCWCRTGVAPGHGTRGSLETTRMGGRPAGRIELSAGACRHRVDHADRLPGRRRRPRANRRALPQPGRGRFSSGPIGGARRRRFLSGEFQFRLFPGLPVFKTATWCIGTRSATRSTVQPRSTTATTN